mmetsp:Transcript_106385/g.211347  ORF Transcript_106385/g.211347 Transcript_106385/m.211347 type:complete len:206 (-) Transcript_106385:909-1526(-)
MPFCDTVSLQFRGERFAAAETKKKSAKLFSCAAAPCHIPDILTTSCNKAASCWAFSYWASGRCPRQWPHGNCIQRAVSFRMVQLLPICTLAQVPEPQKFVMRDGGHKLAIRTEVKLGYWGLVSPQSLHLSTRISAPENELSILMRTDHKIVASAPTHLCGRSGQRRDAQELLNGSAIKSPNCHSRRMPSKAVVACHEPFAGRRGC